MKQPIQWDVPNYQYVLDFSYYIMFDLSYDGLPEMSVEIWELWWMWNSTKHGITMRADSQPFTIKGEQVEEFTFIVNGEREMTKLMEAFSTSSRRHFTEQSDVYKTYMWNRSDIQKNPKVELFILQTLFRDIEEYFTKKQF